jgi:hypothetical protein
MVWEAQPSSRRLFYVFRVEAMVIAGRSPSGQMSIYTIIQIRNTCINTFLATKAKCQHRLN